MKSFVALAASHQTLYHSCCLLSVCVQVEDHCANSMIIDSKKMFVNGKK